MDYVWGLDIVRFLAAAMVVLFHYTWKNQQAGPAFDSGWVGVEIFFVISGFVIASSANNVTAIAFIRRRFSRLYPAAICCAIISYGFILWNGRAAQYAGIFISNTILSFLRSATLSGAPFLT